MIVEIVRAIIAKKRAAHPNAERYAAGYYEIRDRLNAENPTSERIDDKAIKQLLRQACAERRLRWYRGLNFNYFYI